MSAWANSERARGSRRWPLLFAAFACPSKHEENLNGHFHARCSKSVRFYTRTLDWVCAWIHTGVYDCPYKNNIKKQSKHSWTPWLIRALDVVVLIHLSIHLNVLLFKLNRAFSELNPYANKLRRRTTRVGISQGVLCRQVQKWSEDWAMFKASVMTLSTYPIATKGRFLI